MRENTIKTVLQTIAHTHYRQVEMTHIHILIVDKQKQIRYSLNINATLYIKIASGDQEHTDGADHRAHLASETAIL